MGKQDSFVLVHMLKPQPIGSYFDAKRWPLHITFVPWFEMLPAQQPAFEQELTRLGRRLAPVDVIVGDEALFGPRQTVRVNLIATQGMVRPLHESLLGLVRLMQLPLVDEQYVGEAYKAHITWQDDRLHAAPGDRLHIATVTLVRYIDDRTREVIAHFDLQGSDDQLR